MENKVKNGFTLTELLVVVLIIGILAAVAVPQYQKAVMKSQIAQALVIFDAYRKGIELWLLANGIPEVSTRFTGTKREGELDLGIAMTGQSSTMDYVDGLGVYARLMTSGQGQIAIGGWNSDGSDAKWNGCGLRWVMAGNHGEFSAWRFVGMAANNAPSTKQYPVPEKCVPMAKIFCKYWEPTEKFTKDGKDTCDSIGVTVVKAPYPDE